MVDDWASVRGGLAADLAGASSHLPITTSSRLFSTQRSGEIGLPHRVLPYVIAAAWIGYIRNRPAVFSDRAERYSEIAVLEGSPARANGARLVGEPISQEAISSRRVVSSSPVATAAAYGSRDDTDCVARTWLVATAVMPRHRVSPSASPATGSGGASSPSWPLDVVSCELR